MLMGLSGLKGNPRVQVGLRIQTRSEASPPEEAARGGAEGRQGPGAGSWGQDKSHLPFAPSLVTTALAHSLRLGVYFVETVRS